jgi:outer membrane receptor protein involved in Fe transport
MKNRLLLLLLTLFTLPALAQNKATLRGIARDTKNNEPLMSVNVYLKGTSLGGTTELDGKYEIANIPPGEYSVECTYVGYEKQIFTGIKLKAGESRELNFDMTSVMVSGKELTVYGDKPLIDVDNSKTQKTVGKDVIDAAPVKDVQSLINAQTGVVQNVEGIHIRGGRTYETGFYIDGVSASDPLAGTGFGIDLGTNAIDNVEVTTGGAGVEYGNATAGVVSTSTRTGGDKWEVSYTRKQDYLGFNKAWKSYFNQTIQDASIGGSIPTSKKNKLRVFMSVKNMVSDNYFNTPANQLVSSLYPYNAAAPRQDNRWAANVKLNYNFSPKMKLSFTYVRSLNINQDVNMLRITGNDVSFLPGYQYAFALSPDNANTYSHDTNLESLNWFQLINKRWSYRVTASRLFVHLRADANGRQWRPDVVNSEFDPRSIVTFPTTQFNPSDSIVFVQAASGFFNNGGIATLWHDHFVEELTLKTVATCYSLNAMNRFDIGEEIKQQDMQWIDIYRPWIGAPISLSNGEQTQSFRLGDISDVWHVHPTRMALFANDHFKFRGLVADFGLRLEGWMPGKFTDRAVMDPNSPIRDEIRQSYLDNSIGIAGRRIKLRLLPKVSASFPIKENQVMYFNYGHSTVAPHPSFVYPGLDPYYSDRSTLSKIGNPDLNPEVDISYELGLKSQITSKDALTVSAYWKDKYDFITSMSIPIKDVTGREVNRTIYVNADYARVRGIEAAYQKRIGKWFEGQFSAAYSVATGQSSSSSDAIKDILTNGSRLSPKETYLAWDSPWDIKAYALFKEDVKAGGGLFGKSWLNHIALYVDAVYRSGRRYTPYLYTGNEPNSGRPLYEMDPDPSHRFSKLSTGSFLMSANLKKWWTVKGHSIALTLEVTNLLNNKNCQIVNPVTGTYYKLGDPVPTEWKDPMYLDPRDTRSSLLSQGENPSRLNEPRHFLLGFTIKI